MSALIRNIITTILEKMTVGITVTIGIGALTQSLATAAAAVANHNT